MTGFGKAQYDDTYILIQVEIKSLNAKYADVNLHIPKQWLPYFVTWKNVIVSSLVRGKIDVSLQLTYKQSPTTLPVTIQESVFKAYYETFLKLALSVNAPTNGLFKLALKSPEVMVANTERETMHPADFIQQKIDLLMEEALLACQQARSQEGETLSASIRSYLQQIRSGLAAIQQLDTARLANFKQRLVAKLSTITGDLSFDSMRLEQELVYYADKIDITEEKVRLEKHLDYFEEVMLEEAPGKKLGFIIQEMSREINTLGVKSNDFLLQQHIVVMKNEVEKIREQLQNIL